MIAQHRSTSSMNETEIFNLDYLSDIGSHYKMLQLALILLDPNVFHVLRVRKQGS